MDNKLSELSKPVDISNWKMDSWREAPCNGAEWAKGYFEGWNKYHSKVEEHAPLYSQEYVSALLAELEGMEQTLNVANDAIRLWKERALAAEQKLATPVRLPGMMFIKVSGSAVPVMHGERVKERVRAAGFKCMGDE